MLLLRFLLLTQRFPTDPVGAAVEELLMSQVAGSVATRLLPLLRNFLLLMLMLLIIGRRGQEGMIPFSAS